MSTITTSQTIGPFFHEALKWSNDAGVGEVELRGRILDGDGKPITDALIEAWVDVTSGAEAVEGLGLLRQPSDTDGKFMFRLPKPQGSAPLAHICIFARGCLNHHFSAVFAHAVDHPLLNAVASERRNTLIATAVNGSIYEWTIHMQGDLETVFFDYE
jgi:protocatechuate 3,4-dioxygenase, alpha subunit